ncbi:hypothetical protein [Bacillus sp. P14.5]|uniref:hypothetical protein n=1 Tax=Bacillus sp. P14.5 TaxID=1983400 RepID=UPI000DEB8A0A|nr:hypothetical protein [Bacillus sp. P14.5]
MMEDQAIRLREDFLILLNPRIKNEVIVLDKNEEKIILKFKVNESFLRYSLDFESVIRHFTTIQELSGRLEGRLVLKLLSNYPHLFETRDFDDQDVKKDFIQYEFDRTIDMQTLFETYRDHRGERCIYIIWGINETSLALIRALEKADMEVKIMPPTKEEAEDLQFKKLLSMNGSGNEGTEDFVQSLISSENIEEYLEELHSGHKVFILDNRLLDQGIITGEEYSKAAGEGLVIHYGFYSDEFLIGPLVINEESCDYGDFKRNFKGVTALPALPQTLVTAGLISRILYYLEKDTLKYLAEDVQLPINQVFAFNNYSFNSTIINIEGE